MSRAVVIAGLAVGALGLAIGGGPAGAQGASSLGWAAAAGAFLLFMVRGAGLRPLGILLALLGSGAAVAAGLAGGWAWALLVPAVLLVGAAVALVVRGPSWPRREGAGPRAAAMDDWKQFDAGIDPTGTSLDDDMARDEDSR